MMATADRLLFVASALLECRQSLKERQLLCDEISRISDTVRRMEECLDAAVGSAHDDALMAHAQSEVVLLRPARPPAKPKLRVVTA